MTRTSPKDFMETLRKKVEAEYDLEKENLMKFFIEHNYSFEQSKELTNSLRSAIFYIKKDHKKRRKLEKETINYLREQKKIEIKNLEVLVGKRESLEEITTDDKIFYRALLQKLKKDLELQSIPRSGHNVMFRLALAPLFWKLKKFGLGQAKQLNITYDLFVQYELDDYGLDIDDGETYVGETEQKDRIRTQFQQRAMKYFNNFGKHMGWG